MTTLVASFSDGSFAFLQVTRTIIKAWTSLNFAKMSSPTTEHMHLSVWKLNEYCCDHSSALSFDWIFFILAAGNEGNH